AGFLIRGCMMTVSCPCWSAAATLSGFRGLLHRHATMYECDMSEPVECGPSRLSSHGPPPRDLPALLPSGARNAVVGQRRHHPARQNTAVLAMLPTRSTKGRSVARAECASDR